MFTGLVREVGTLRRMTTRGGVVRLEIGAPQLSAGLTVGDSVGVRVGVRVGLSVAVGERVGVRVVVGVCVGVGPASSTTIIESAR